MQLDFLNDTELNILINKADRLLIYHQITKKEIFTQYFDLIASIIKNNKKDILDNYYQLSSGLLEYSQSCADKSISDPWQNYMLNFILSDENILTNKISSLDFENKKVPIYEALKHDLNYFEKIFRLNLVRLSDYISSKIIDHRENLFCPEWEKEKDDHWNYPRQEIKRKMYNSDNWSNIIDELIKFFQVNGTGILNCYKAFKWEKGLKGIRNIDKVSLEQIIGYDKQKEKVIDNTKKLINGYQANNILLHGTRGTGKSSTIKAILNQYWMRGLRLIEVNKNQFKCFPQIFDRLEKSNLYFIIFIDDLSFEENETGYKQLKATLEGKTKLMPSNIVIYTTSNRKHLVKENYDDSNQLKRKESKQEKLSLADRFGISLYYSTPTQQEYLNIVLQLAKQRKLTIETDKLKQKAKKWAMWQNGRSGRTARQFIDHLEGELASN